MKNAKYSYSCMCLLLSILNTGCSESTDSILDLNNDGTKDIYYEYVENGHYELLDRNFDSRIDQSSFYGSSGVIVLSKYDDNYDGIMETTAVYKLGLIHELYVDTDLDDKPNIVYSYQNDVLISSKRYSFSDDLESVEVETLFYEYGYPKLDNIKSELLLPKEYSNRMKSYFNLNK